MKRKLVLTTPALLALSAINLQLSTAFAQGTAFTYQGRLSVNGVPANGSYDWQFRLASDPLGNNYIGSPYVTNGIGVSDGLFTTTLDFGSSIFGGSNYWLEVDVRTNNVGSYTRLTPLQELTPAPYAIMANSASNLLGTLPARQLSGTLLTGSLPASPTFSGTLTAGSFAGNGANMTNVNALALNGLGSGALWQLGGNNATGGQFLGTTNNQSLEIRAGGQRALLIMPSSADAPSILGGAPVNFINPAVEGAVIAGGGTANFSGSYSANAILENFGSIGGGSGNSIQSQADHSFIGGGLNNLIDNGAYESVIAGGWNNINQGQSSAIGGGEGNLISAFTGSPDHSVIGGGYQNTVTGPSDTISGGGANTAMGILATVAGGGNNLANGYAATVGGGLYNSATNAWAVIPGGNHNVAAASFSFAAGNQAQALHQGAFVWADSQNATFSSTGNDQFLIRAHGGVGINTSNPNGASFYASGNRAGGFPYSVGWFENTSTDPNASPALRVIGLQTPDGVLSVSANVPASTPNSAIAMFGNSSAFVVTIAIDGTISCKTVVSTSDRNAKENFTVLDSKTVLAKVAALPVTQWNYKEDGPGKRHIGPVAQDFHAAFELNGSDETHIATVDEAGVALAAIQGLNQKLDEQLKAKDRELDELRLNVAQLQELLSRQRLR